MARPRERKKGAARRRPLGSEGGEGFPRGLLRDRRDPLLDLGRQLGGIRDAGLHQVLDARLGEVDVLLALLELTLDARAVLLERALDAGATLTQLALDARAGLLDLTLEAVAGGRATALEAAQLALGLLG